MIIRDTFLYKLQKKEEIAMSLNNKVIEKVYIGVEKENDGPITKGFVGCVEVRDRMGLSWMKLRMRFRYYIGNHNIIITLI